MRCAPERTLWLALCAASLPACKDDAPDDDAADAATTEAGDSSGDSSGDSAGDTNGSGGSESETGDPLPDPGPWEALDERPCPDDSFLSYENFGWPHMLTFCTGCHSSMLPADMRQGAPIEINFDSLEDVRARADRIWARAADQHATMPPVGPAADEERLLLGEWLACGSPTDDDLADP